jgi:hypothetical protein
MSWTFRQGLACIKKDKKFGFIDRTGRVVIEPQWDVAKDYRETEDKDAPVYWLVAREEDKPGPFQGPDAAQNERLNRTVKPLTGQSVRVLWLDSFGKQIWSSDNSNSSTGQDALKSPPPSVSPGQDNQPNQATTPARQQ